MLHLFAFTTGVIYKQQWNNNAMCKKIGKMPEKEIIIVSIEFSPLSSMDTNNGYQLHNGDYW